MRSPSSWYQKCVLTEHWNFFAQDTIDQSNNIYNIFSCKSEIAIKYVASLKSLKKTTTKAYRSCIQNLCIHNVDVSYALSWYHFTRVSYAHQWKPESHHVYNRYNIFLGVSRTGNFVISKYDINLAQQSCYV